MILLHPIVLSGVQYGIHTHYAISVDGFFNSVNCRLAMKTPSPVFRVGGIWDFDDVSQKHGCEVHSFDPR